MDYGLIKTIAIDKGSSIKALAESIGMTPAGFHKAIRKETLTIDKLESISQALKVPIVFFFGYETDEKNGFVRDPFRDKYYDLLEKYNGCLEERETLRVENKKSRTVPKPAH